MVQIFRQVGTLPFNVVSGPGIQGALGYGILHGRYHVSALLPEASRNDREEGKHYKPNQAKHGTTSSLCTLLQNPLARLQSSIKLHQNVQQSIIHM